MLCPLHHHNTIAVRQEVREILYEHLRVYKHEHKLMVKRQWLCFNNHTPLHTWLARSMVWYGMVWYGMVWYGMVWYNRLRKSLTLSFTKICFNRKFHVTTRAWFSISVLPLLVATPSLRMILTIQPCTIMVGLLTCLQIRLYECKLAILLPINRGNVSHFATSASVSSTTMDAYRHTSAVSILHFTA